MNGGVIPTGHRNCVVGIWEEAALGVATVPTVTATRVEGNASVARIAEAKEAVDECSEEHRFDG
jgi:hypothetical protein